uniref:Uncharacterized protein n=1 Tax=Phaseolus vulgaris TaxID=3885 RepID=V7CXY4_PHAVU|nr:hypothetical protein PHAVU_001G127600g [Phaseolus vulgaris]ESW34135.1 hypothetical protein PHAVU_001G127600g [Phaseolus vulgaris]
MSHQYSLSLSLSLHLSFSLYKFQIQPTNCSKKHRYSSFSLSFSVTSHSLDSIQTVVSMAGLQQYNFFPTDLLYPRPQPQQASPKPTLLPLQTPNPKDHTQHQQPPRTNATPSTSALLHTQNTQSLTSVDTKLSKFSSDPLSWLLWMTEDEQQNASDSS